MGKSWRLKNEGIVQSTPERCYGTVGSDDANQVNDDSVDDQEVLTFGLGAMTSFMNLANGAVPVLLAGAESIGGYVGLEAVFLALAGFGFLVSIQLAWMWNGI